MHSHSHHADHGDPHLSLDRGETHTHHHLGHGGHSGRLVVALLLTLSFAAVEAVVGWWANSLALMADAGHMVTDSSSLGLAAAAGVPAGLAQSGSRLGSRTGRSSPRG